MSESPQPPSEQHAPQAPQDDSQREQDNLYLESYAFTTAAAIVGSVDKKVFVLLRDGRNLFGILRTFDQYANLVLQDTTERIYLEGSRFAEAYRGVFLIRGENVVMLGDLDIDREDEPIEKLTQVPYEEAEQELNGLNKKKIETEKAKAKKLLSKGLTSDFTKTDLY